MGLSLPSDRRTWRRWILSGILVAALLWVLFFDSHSVLKRLRWHYEYDRLTTENQELRQKIDQLEQKLDEPLPDEVVEQIAREEYGMKRPDETVYPVEPE